MIRNPDNMSEGELRRLVRKIVDELYRNDWTQLPYVPWGDVDSDAPTVSELGLEIESILMHFGLCPSVPCDMEEAGKPLPFPCTCDGPIPPEQQMFLEADEARTAHLKCECVVCLVCGGWLEMGRPGTCTKP